MIKQKTVCMISLLIISAVFLMVHFVMNRPVSDNYEVLTNSHDWTISTERKNRGTFGQCDATDHHLYFSYWNSNNSQIDVYDNQGGFLYMISFQDRKNGRIYIRCDHSQVYVKLRNDTVFIFEGIDEIEKLSENEADQLGYTNDWFQSAVSSISVDNDNIYRLDANGNPTSQITKPKTVKTNTAIVDFGPTVNLIVFSFGMVTLMALSAWVIFGRPHQ